MRDISVMFYNHVIVLCITEIHSFELHFCVFNFQTKRLACVRKPLKSSKQEKYKVHRLPEYRFVTIFNETKKYKHLSTTFLQMKVELHRNHETTFSLHN